MQLAKHHVRVCINYSKSSKQATAVKKRIEACGGEAIIFKADLTKEDEVMALFQFLSEKFASLDILVNNAGIGFAEHIEHTSYQDWDRIIQTNLSAKFLCTKHAIPLLKKSSNATIVNIASRIGTAPVELASAYCSAAAGILMFSKVSALELAHYNIRVNSISPGLVKTPLTEKMYPKKYLTDYAKKNPLKRICSTTDIANAVLFLTSDTANFITGENINVSGGMLLK